MPDVKYRVGAGSLAMLAGAVIGLLSAVLVFAASGHEPSFAAFVFGGALAGAAIGIVQPQQAMAVVEGLIHFVFGAFSAAADAELDNTSGEALTPEAEAPPWLKMAFFFGVAYAFVLWLLL